MSEGEQLGEVTHYYGRIQVAVLRLTRGLKQGQRLRFHGAHTDFEQQAASLQVNHTEVTEAKPGTEVAIKVDQVVKQGDGVFLVGG